MFIYCALANLALISPTIPRNTLVITFFLFMIFLYLTMNSLLSYIR